MKISMKLARNCCWPKLHPSLRSILLSVIGLWVKIWHRNKTACSESNPVQSSRSKSTTCPGKGICSDLNQTAQQLQIVALKSLETMSGIFWIDHNQSLQTNLLHMKCNVWKPCSYQCWQDKLQFSIWRFFEQSSFVIIHLLCYWPSIHN